MSERERKENEKREKIERGCEGKNERETCQREREKGRERERMRTEEERPKVTCNKFASEKNCRVSL